MEIYDIIIPPEPLGIEYITLPDSESLITSASN